MAVFVRSNVKGLVSQVHISEVKLGFKGQMGNKVFDWENCQLFSVVSVFGVVV